MLEIYLFLAIWSFLAFLIPIWRITRREWDPLEAAYPFIVFFVLVYCLHPLILRKYLLPRFGKEAIIDAGLVISLACMALFLGYRARAGQTIAGYLPLPEVAQDKGRRLFWIGFAFWCIGVLAHILFINRSGGFLVFFSVGRGAGAYEGTTAYFYGLKLLILPGAVLMIVCCRSTFAGKIPAAICTACAAVWFLYQVGIGQRSGIIACGYSYLAAFYLPTRRRPGACALVGVFFTIALLVTLVTQVREEIHVGSDFRKTRSIMSWDLEQVVKEPHVGPDEGKRSGSMFVLLLNCRKHVPANVPYTYGENYLNIFVHWIPRVVWPQKPKFGADKWSRLMFVSTGSGAGGPTLGILGRLNFICGLPAVTVGMLLTGVLLRTQYEYLRRGAGNAWAVCLYTFLLPFNFLLVGASFPAILCSVLPFLIVPLALAALLLGPSYPEPVRKYWNKAAMHSASRFKAEAADAGLCR